MALLCTVSSGAVTGASQSVSGGPPSQTYQGLQITVRGLERATIVSLQDCPPGGNTVRGVIRPGEENEFATITIDVEVLPSFRSVELTKPLLYGEEDEIYKTAQSFGDVGGEPSYSCRFSFRVGKGAKVTRFAIEDASFDLATLEE